jgi:two-component system sensor histidine kinase AlgZ
MIRVRTRVKLGRSLISIANSVPSEPSRPGNGMALRNVRERLRLMHDVAAQFDTRIDNGVFRVQIVVPL